MFQVQCSSKFCAEYQLQFSPSLLLFTSLPLPSSISLSLPSSYYFQFVDLIINCTIVLTISGTSQVNQHRCVLVAGLRVYPVERGVAPTAQLREARGCCHVQRQSCRGQQWQHCKGECAENQPELHSRFKFCRYCEIAARIVYAICSSKEGGACVYVHQITCQWPLACYYSNRYKRAQTCTCVRPSHTDIEISRHTS